MMDGLLERIRDITRYIFGSPYEIADMLDPDGGRIINQYRVTRLRETAWPHDLRPIPARVWAKLPPNKRKYIIKSLPSCGRA